MTTNLNKTHLVEHRSDQILPFIELIRARGWSQTDQDLLATVDVEACLISKEIENLDNSVPRSCGLAGKN